MSIHHLGLFDFSSYPFVGYSLATDSWNIPLFGSATKTQLTLSSNVIRTGKGHGVLEGAWDLPQTVNPLDLSGL